jgi:hypothetical protein
VLVQLLLFFFISNCTSKDLPFLLLVAIAVESQAVGSRHVALVVLLLTNEPWPPLVVTTVTLLNKLLMNVVLEGFCCCWLRTAVVVVSQVQLLPVELKSSLLRQTEFKSWDAPPPRRAVFSLFLSFSFDLPINFEFTNKIK